MNKSKNTSKKDQYLRRSGDIALMHSKSLRKELEALYKDVTRLEYQLNKVEQKKDFVVIRIAKLEKELKQRKIKGDEPANQVVDPDKE